MLVELLRFAAALLLLVLIPGYVAVQAVFPRGRSHVSLVERGYLVVVGGIVLLILVGVTLGFLPHGQRGFFETMATGSPNVEIGLLAVTLALLYVGLQRGAYPGLAKRFPRLKNPDASRRTL